MKTEIRNEEKGEKRKSILNLYELHIGFIYTAYSFHIALIYLSYRNPLKNAFLRSHLIKDFKTQGENPRYTGKSPPAAENIRNFNKNRYLLKIKTT